MEVLADFLSALAGNQVIRDTFPFLVGLWGSVVMLFKTRLGKKLMDKSVSEATEAAKDKLGISELHTKVDNLSTFTKKHLENGDETPMVERHKKLERKFDELTELVTRP